MKPENSGLLCVGRLCAPRLAVDILGWAGALAILTAYGGSSFGLISSADASYQGLNLFGALGVVVSSLPRKAYQATALNAVWSAIALVALFRLATG